jgi:hypothetical protein
MSWNRNQNQSHSVGGIDWRHKIAYAIGSCDGSADQNVIGARPMIVSQTTVEAFLTALRALPEEEQQAVVVHIVEDEEWQEDIKNLAVFAQRRNEPSGSFRDIFEKHGKSSNDS